MSFDIRKSIKDFILGEGLVNKPSLQSFIESVSKILESMKPNSVRETRYLEVAKHQLREVKNGVRKLMEEKQILEERLAILEEEQSKRKGKKR
ncbi:MAG: hypothetical protein Q8P81_03440 [Nanoarchaeota archaeon]|nr:hypothetical protein [Nanoarchaeota archaeon]